MYDMNRRLERIVWAFLLSAAACLASGAALATCTNSGGVACYIKVQPIDVCPNNDPTSCAPFNTVSNTGAPNGSVSPLLPQAGYPPQTLTTGNAPSELVG